MISLQQFAAIIGCTQMTAAAWYVPMSMAMAERSINTARRVAGFLANVGHESGSLAHTEESLNYTAQRLMAVWPRRFQTIESAHYYEHAPERLANFVYANRMGNGGYESGDGWRYRGRGPIQVTGGDNYRRCGAALNLPLVAQPELLLEPKHGARSAAWFWDVHGCNAAADTCDHADMCVRVNGGSAGLEDRTARFDLAMKVMA
jgi:putative chitinase